MKKTKEEQQGILLESGTNEFEFVEFKIGTTNYGINVAKVREVIQNQRFTVTPMPQTHPEVMGLFTLRGRSIPLVRLANCLNTVGNPNPQNIIVTEINNFYAGFLVDSVNRIHRISWNSMESLPEIGHQERVLGIVRLSGKMILMIDFESIIAEVSSAISAKLSAVDKNVDYTTKLKRARERIVIADDSPLLRGLIAQTLRESGYTNLKEFTNGKDTWNYLRAVAEKDPDFVKAVVTDIEMPQMDGHRLLKLIRDHSELRGLPVVLFSSLINDEMKVKGNSLGANGQLSKLEIDKLSDLLDDLIFTKPKKKN